MLRLTFLGIFLSFVSILNAEETISAKGLVLHLDAGQNVETYADHNVVRWTDISSNKRVAAVPKGRSAPQYDAKNKRISFQNGNGLFIDEQILSADSRELSVFAVAKPSANGSVSLVGFRTGQTPLIQLDTDDNGMARWIVRDIKNHTVSALTPAVLDAQTMFGGVMKITDKETLLSIFYHDKKESVSDSGLTTPLITKGVSIGCLEASHVPKLSWTGTISEILIYDRVLADEEITAIKQYFFKKHQIQDLLPAFQDSWNVLNIPRYNGEAEKEISADVCVIGVGSAGSAAAIAAAREGVNVVAVERQELLGGTGVNAEVSNWEPGPGCSLAREIFERMKAIGGAGVARGYQLTTNAAYAYNLITEGETYESTTHRTNVSPKLFRDVPYKPEAFDQVVREMLAETNRVTILDKTYFFQAEPNAEKTRLESVFVRNEKNQTIRIRAKIFIDCSGDVYVCRSLGCEVMLGVDSKSAFNEPSAPEKGFLQLNAITRCYEIAPSSHAKKQSAPDKPVSFPATAYITGWKDGTLSVNMMPTLPGRVLIDYGYDETLRRSEQVVYAHWHWLQQIPEFQNYELVRIAPMLGIREGYRVKTKYVLNEQDLIDTLKNQKHSDMIAIADHPCDIHGASGGLRHVTDVYGIPYRCMIPAGSYQNILVSCRGAGFSRIAASSCRLQRTMIQLGHAAGVAAAWSSQKDSVVENIDIPSLVKKMNAPARYKEYQPPIEKF